MELLFERSQWRTAKRPRSARCFDALMEFELQSTNGNIRVHGFRVCAISNGVEYGTLIFASAGQRVRASQGGRERNNVSIRMDTFSAYKAAHISCAYCRHSEIVIADASGFSTNTVRRRFPYVDHGRGCMKSPGEQGARAGCDSIDWAIMGNFQPESYRFIPEQKLMGLKNSSNWQH
jgi:hypothetical protein